MNPETRERIKGMAEGIVRVQASETPFSAVRRFHELQREARRAQEASDHWSQQVGYLHGRIFGWTIEADLEMYAAGFSGRIAKGPGIRREIVLFDTVKIPWTETRGRRGSKQKPADPLRMAQIAHAENDELMGRYSEGEMPQDAYDAIEHNEKIARGQ